MKKIQLLAAALLMTGAAFAQSAPNARPAAQGRGAAVRAIPTTTQISATSRGAGSVDHDSYVQQVGENNYGVVRQTGADQSADMYQAGNGNDAYQTQSGNSPLNGQNTAYSSQTGDNNYVDQVQSGYRGVAIVEQGGAGDAQNSNYAVQEQAGDNNYGYIDQDSDGNFAHQKQTSPTSIFVNGVTGNFADTRQGDGSFGSNNQWSQVVQTGEGNAAIVRQDHP